MPPVRSDGPGQDVKEHPYQAACTVQLPLHTLSGAESLQCTACTSGRISDQSGAANPIIANCTLGGGEWAPNPVVTITVMYTLTDCHQNTTHCSETHPYPTIISKDFIF